MMNERTMDELKARLAEIEAEVKGTKVDKTATDEKKEKIYNSAFWEHMHTGMPSNALKEGSDGAGGYLVPDEYNDRLVKALEDKKIMRKLGTTMTTEHDLKIPVVIEDGVADWIEEGKPMSFMDVEFGQVTIGAHKLAAAVRCTDELLEDSGVDLEKYVEDAFVEAIGAAEEEAFIMGDGKGKPTGIVYQAEVGVEVPLEDLNLDAALLLMYSVKRAYREKGAVFVMSEEAYRILRKEKVRDGRYVWATELQDGEPDTLFGVHVYVSKDMPELASGNAVILYGDFSYFWIGDRGKRKIKRLEERYAEQGLVAFITSERVDAKLVIPETVKTLKIK